MSSTPSSPPRVVMLLAWLVAFAPLGWGLYQSLLDSKLLLAAAPAASAPVAYHKIHKG